MARSLRKFALGAVLACITCAEVIYTDQSATRAGGRANFAIAEDVGVNKFFGRQFIMDKILKDAVDNILEIFIIDVENVALAKGAVSKILKKLVDENFSSTNTGIPKCQVDGCSSVAKVGLCKECFDSLNSQFNLALRASA